MNGSNSNTSGGDVLSLSALPASVYNKLAGALQQILLEFESVQQGASAPVKTDYATQGPSDQIPNEVMAEIARRLVATVLKAEETANIIFQADAPSDHTKAWQQIDPVTNLPVGQYKIWNDTDGKWEAVSETVASTYTPPMEFFTRVVAPPGASTQNVTLPDFKGTNYNATITPTTLNGSNYAAAPGSISGFGWLVTNKANTQLTIAFFGTPNLGSSGSPIGVSFDVSVRANPTP